ncbi:MAG: rhomboid family intramembrane serine protease [Cyclobacteriaceae bacterium]
MFKHLNLTPTLRMTFLLWLTFSIQFYLGTDLGFLGIYPRHFSGLLGVITGPLVHGDWVHLMSNTFPFLFLSGAIYLFYPKIANQVFIQCYLITGLLVWVFGRSFYHIGISGVVYGLAFFLISLGLFRKDFKSLLISIITISIYGGLIYGLLPEDTYVSWESHLMGAIVGVGTAMGIAKFSPKSTT